MLRIYTARHCPTHERTRQLAVFLQSRFPLVRVQLINTDSLDVKIPDFVYSTPTYVWNERVIFLGNPSEQALMERLGQNGFGCKETHTR